MARFLSEVDRHLDSPARMIVIGGAAALLEHQATRMTTDIDTADSISEALQSAIDAAFVNLDIRIPVTPAGVYDAPYAYEERLIECTSLELRRLSVLVPERHDLALMKIVRGYEHDIEVIAEMHLAYPLEPELLLGRFRDEMKHVNKPSNELKLSLLALLDRLFGETVARTAEQEIAAWTTV